MLPDTAFPKSAYWLNGADPLQWLHFKHQIAKGNSYMNVGFIGTGKISSAVVEGLCRSDLEDLSIRLSPRSEQTSRKLAQTYASVERCAGNQQVLDESNLVCLAVRPNDARQVLKELVFREDHTVVSFVPFLLKADSSISK